MPYTVLHAQKGTLDALRTKGIKALDLRKAYNTAKAVLIQPDGKIVLSGFATNRINEVSVLRLNEDGTPDPTFGQEGMASSLLYSSVMASSLALQADGKIVLGGQIWTGTCYEFMLIRYSDKGLIDATFGDSGLVITGFPHKSSIANSVAIQADGKIVLAGYAYSNLNEFDDFALARYHPDGSPDSTFDHDGRVVKASPVRTNDYFNSVHVQTTYLIISNWLFIGLICVFTLHYYKRARFVG